MNGPLALLLAALGGVLLGLFFFGGLWWTVRRAFDSPRPALWVGGSLLLRMGGTVGGFLAVSAGDWQRLLACLLGFLFARWLVVRLSVGLAGKPSGIARFAPGSGGDGETS